MRESVYFALGLFKLPFVSFEIDIFKIFFSELFQQVLNVKFHVFRIDNVGFEVFKDFGLFAAGLGLGLFKLFAGDIGQGPFYLDHARQFRISLLVLSNHQVHVAELLIKIAVEIGDHQFFLVEIVNRVVELFFEFLHHRFFDKQFFPLGRLHKPEYADLAPVVPYEIIDLAAVHPFEENIGRKHNVDQIDEFIRRKSGVRPARVEKRVKFRDVHRSAGLSGIKRRRVRTGQRGFFA
ncbi:MAG: hypothetical protein ACD_47C00255G0002 [uncultured bacterium]|nr:MAG: hypothetical protein ACD_47C00255G0002 [uncultured bacterium]